jgi:Male sterility protein.
MPGFLISVVSTWKEPIVGWSNNLYGPGGAAAGAALGLIHTFYAKHDKKCDLIPVDVATNMMLGVVWKTALDHGHVAPPGQITLITLH